MPWGILNTFTVRNVELKNGYVSLNSF